MGDEVESEVWACAACFPLLVSACLDSVVDVVCCLCASVCVRLPVFWGVRERAVRESQDAHASAHRHADPHGHAHAYN